MFSSYQEGLLVLLGINVLTAFSVYSPLATGQLSLGNAGFMAIGAYISAILTLNFGVGLQAALILGGLSAGVSGVLVGFPALRLRGVFLAMATLAFGEVVRTIFLNLSYTGGAYGLRGMMGTTLPMVWLWVLAVTLFFFLLMRSPFGLNIHATHDDEEVGELTGINVTRVKVGAFGIGAFIAGVAGGLYAHYLLYIEPSLFGFLESIYMLLYVILGGMTTFWGCLVGAAVFTLLPEYLRFLERWRGAFFGAIIVLMMILRPQGLLTRELLRLLTNRRGPTQPEEVPARVQEVGE
ncbi:MAG: branched-chain amino acid ABC transporter permease [Candidatus Tectomicrobia bacterium]|nr:branched-chain amino acid ABC transporter permease [Candidatus Tectomicrobia bacterium]